MASVHVFNPPICLPDSGFPFSVSDRQGSPCGCSWSRGGAGVVGVDGTWLVGLVLHRLNPNVSHQSWGELLTVSSPWRLGVSDRTVLPRDSSECQCLVPGCLVSKACGLSHAQCMPGLVSLMCVVLCGRWCGPAPEPQDPTLCFSHWDLPEPLWLSPAPMPAEHGAHWTAQPGPKEKLCPALCPLSGTCWVSLTPSTGHLRKWRLSCGEGLGSVPCAPALAGGSGSWEAFHG